MLYNLDDFLQGRIAVHAGDKNFLNLMCICEELGLVWATGDKPTELAERYGNIKDICIRHSRPGIVRNTLADYIQTGKCPIVGFEIFRQICYGEDDLPPVHAEDLYAILGIDAQKEDAQ